MRLVIYLDRIDRFVCVVFGKNSTKEPEIQLDPVRAIIIASVCFLIKPTGDVQTRLLPAPSMKNDTNEGATMGIREAATSHRGSDFGLAINSHR